MAYIGRQSIIGNFVKLDSITVVNGQAAYTMQNGGSNFTDYESVNQFLISLNGIIQAPTDSFTVSGSTLTFASNLATGDVIDFVMVFGNSLSAGTPTDATITAAKLTANAITGQTAETSIADSDTILIHDDSANALRKMTKANFVSGVGGTNTPAFLVKMDADQTIATNTFTKLELDTETYDTDNAFASFKFTVPSGEDGKYVFHYGMSTDSITSSTVGAVVLYKNGSLVDETFARSYPNQSTGAYPHKSCVLSLSASDYIELYGQHTKGSNANIQSEYTFLAGHKLIGV